MLQEMKTEEGRWVWRQAGCWWPQPRGSSQLWRKGLGRVGSGEKELRKQ